MKVKAIEDGTYGGYYRMGPSPDGQFMGEVFEIDEKPFEVRDHETGNPIFEKDVDGKPIQLTDEKGKLRFDSKGKPMFKIKMASWFSPKWMEMVPETTEVTFDYPPFELPVMYRAKKPKGGAISPALTVHSPEPVPSVI